MVVLLEPAGSFILPVYIWLAGRGKQMSWNERAAKAMGWPERDWGEDYDGEFPIYMTDGKRVFVSFETKGCGYLFSPITKGHHAFMLVDKCLAEGLQVECALTEEAKVVVVSNDVVNSTYIGDADLPMAFTRACVFALEELK